MLARLSVMVVVLLGITPVMAATQTSMAAHVEAVRRAVTARDHATALAHADSLWAKAPAHPQSALTRAVALAAAGRDAEAEQVVRVLLRWDARYARRALQDSTLRHLRERLGVNVDSLAQLADLPISRGEVWAVLEERDLVPEGTAWDPSTRSLLVGSLNKSKVVAIGADGVARDRVPSGAHGLGSVVGIHVDSVRGVLWVSSTPRFDNAADTITPAVFAFDVATGAFGRRVNMTGRPSFLNDLTTTPDGTLYVTDSRAGRVFTLRPDAQSFDTLMLTAPLTSPNGITVSDDGRFLFVSDIDHVRVVSLGDARDWRLAVPDSINMAGIDGLAFTDNALIAHHPLAFWRIARYELDPAFRRVERAEFIERNSPDARTSTTGEVVGDHYYYIGNSQIDRMNQRTIDAATMDPIRMYRIRYRVESRHPYRQNDDQLFSTQRRRVKS